MNIFAYTLKSDSYNQIVTEIRYLIATARATERELVLIKPNELNEENFKTQSIIEKALRLIKKEGKIDFFANGEDFSIDNAKARYLLNKYPDTVKDATEGKSDYIVKVQ